MLSPNSTDPGGSSLLHLPNTQNAIMLTEGKVMTHLKDTHNQTVVAISYWMWVVGGLSTTLGILFVIVLWMMGWDVPLSVFAAAGGLLFVGIFFFVGLTTKVTFDNILGNITIRQYIWLWPYRTRHIPKEEVQYAVTSISEEPSSVPGAIDIHYHNVLIGVRGRREIKIGTLRRSKAKYLADRINAFVRFE